MVPSRWKHISQLLSSKQPLSLQTPLSAERYPPHITQIGVHDWQYRGNAVKVLYGELDRLYWIGIEREIHSLLFAVHELQQDGYSLDQLERERNKEIHSIDTFVDQMGEHRHEFAKQLAALKRNLAHSKSGGEPSQDQLDSLAQQAQAAEAKSSQLKSLICNAISDDIDTPLRRLVRMLLRACGLLDIEKLVEHRRKFSNRASETRPGIPQLAPPSIQQELGIFDRKYPTLNFKPLSCTTCGDLVVGSMYQEIAAVEQEAVESGKTLCEACYHEERAERDQLPERGEYAKVIKHSPLQGAISTETLESLCCCHKITWVDEDGLSVLVPLKPPHEHHMDEKSFLSPCQLYRFPNKIAEAKFDGLLSKSGIQMPTQELDPSRFSHYHCSDVKLAPAGQRLLWYACSGRYKTENILADKVKTGEVPWFLREHEEKHPFGNMHMALRIGPLVIENGISKQYLGGSGQTREGDAKVLVHLRGSQTLHSPGFRTPPTDDCITVSDGNERQVWRSEYKKRRPHLKTVLKQVVGVPFTGCLDQDLEGRIVSALIDASKVFRSTEVLEAAESVGAVKKLIKDLISPHVIVYLRELASRLVDTNLELGWDFVKNNCQTFCDNLLDLATFRPLFSECRVDTDVQDCPKNIMKDISATTRGTIQPQLDHNKQSDLYLISFVCRPTPSVALKLNSKFDIPKGLHEEYMCNFRYGMHDEADSIDSLLEYWLDWASMPRMPYQFQDLFPWDCTEAYRGDTPKCGACSLSKHVWAFPFDAWSMTSQHLARERDQYPQSEPSQGLISDQQWAQNRSRVLLAQEKLFLVTVAMARTPEFRAATAWLHQQPNARLDRIKLGGIHRAQPYSHYYERQPYHGHFIAKWALQSDSAQLEAYERLRDARAQLSDIEAAYAHYAGDAEGTQISITISGTNKAGVIKQLGFPRARIRGPLLTRSDSKFNVNIFVQEETGSSDDRLEAEVDV